MEALIARLLQDLEQGRLTHRRDLQISNQTRPQQR